MSEPQSGSFFAADSKSFKAVLGDIELYVNKWQLGGQRIISEQASVNGINLVTNSSGRFRRLILEGIWVNDNEPDNLIVKLEDFIQNYTSFTVNLHHIVFTDCRLVKYTLSESGCEPCINIKLELLALSSSTDEEGESTGEENESG